MAKEGKQDDDIISKLVAGLFYLLIGPIAFIVGIGLRLIFGLFQKPITKALRLKRLSAFWPSLKWFFNAVQMIALFFFFVVLIRSIYQVYVWPNGSDNAIQIAAGFCVSLVFGFIFIVMTWLEAYAEDPAVQKENAGLAAERFVRRQIHRQRRQYPHSRAVHGALFVFHRGTDQEFSAEADHLFITQRHIFVIETKYKSGRIEAHADAPTWAISSSHGGGTMRNALLQVKNTARVLRRECSLPDALIPLVAIYGMDVDIVDAPGNVVAAQDLMRAIQAFESHGGHGAALDPEDIYAGLRQYIADDEAALTQHNQRASAAQARNEMDNIVRSASIK